MRIDKFKGLNNQQAPTEFGLGGMVQADDVDITAANKVRSRANVEQVLSDGIIASAQMDGFFLYLNDSGQLVGGQGISNLKTYRSGLTFSQTLNAWVERDAIYWTTGIDSGVIHKGINRQIGLSSPAINSLAVEAGSMRAGTYLCAVTVSRNGFESGASAIKAITLANGQAILLNLSNIDQTADKVSVYVSAVDGEVPFLALETTPNNQIYFDGDTSLGGVPVTGLNCNEPPKFSQCFVYRGRMFYVDNDVIWYSLPFNFELIDYSAGFIQIGAKIHMAAPVDQGIFVATNTETMFLSGLQPESFNKVNLFAYGAPIGNASFADYVGENNQKAALWVSHRGICAGFDSGQATNLTIKQFIPDTHGHFSVFSRSHNGEKHLIASARK